VLDYTAEAHSNRSLRLQKAKIQQKVHSPKLDFHFTEFSEALVRAGAKFVNGELLEGSENSEEKDAA